MTEGIPIGLYPDLDKIFEGTDRDKDRAYGVGDAIATAITQFIANLPDEYYQNHILHFPDALSVSS